MQKKVAMIDPSFFTWPYDKALVEGLRAQGHDAVLYTKFLAAKEQGKNVPYVKEFFYPGFQTEFMKSLPHPLFLAMKGVAHFFSLLALFLKLHRGKPDVIHFQWAPLPVIDRMFVPLFRRIAPVVLTVHDSSPFNNNPKSKLQAMGSIDIMRDFDSLIVHTEKAMVSLKKYGLAQDDIARIEHGVLGVDMKADIKPPSTDNPDRPVTVLLFGHLKHYKGADILIEALAKMPETTRAKTKLRIVGKPQMDTEPLFARANELGVDGNITWDLRFVGEDEIAEMFETSDITAMPYREIDASGVLMVSLSIGRPIVASRIGLFAELLEDGTHGYLVPMEDAAALAEALTRLVDNPALRLEMGNNVRALGNSIPSWNEIAEKTDQLYSRVIAARN